MTARRALLPALLLAAACGGGRPSPDAVARLGKEDLAYPTFETYLRQSLGEPAQGLGSEVLSQLFDQFIEERLLAQLAADEEVAAPDASAREAVGKLLAAKAEPEPSRAELEAAFRARAADFVRPERVRLRQILVREESAARAALAEIQRGADFAEVARRRSEEPNAARGGDQGVLAKSDLPPAFAEPIFALAAGEVSGIIPVDYGFHLFQVVERYPAASLSFAEAEPELRASLRREQADRALEKLAAEARSRYNPVIYERNLPFNYVGRFRTPAG